MLKKSHSKSGRSCRVTFKLSAEQASDATSVAVLGEWNEWSADAHPLERRKDGTWSTTLSLDAGREYRFRYLVDGERWINDDAPDGEAPNRFGSRDCLVAV